MFDRKTYEVRRRELTAALKEGLILLLGNEESPMNYQGNDYPFRQDSSFLYYVGIDHPHLAVVIDIETGETTLFGEEVTLDDIVWMGPQPSLADQAAASGILQTAPYDDLPALLADHQSRDRSIHYLPHYRHDNIARLHQWLSLPIDQVKAGASSDLIRAVVAQRSVKSDEEIAEMEWALRITGAMHLAAMRGARPGIREARLAGIVEGTAVAAGGRLSYPVILTVNGQTLHNHYHGNELRDGQLVLGDFGAETARHYAGDITRTFPVSRTFTPRQRDIYQIVLDAQLAAIAFMQPGRRFLDAHLLAARTIAGGLKDLGIMRGDVDEAVNQGAHALFLPHGLGHMIGLDVHDMEDLGEDYVGYSEELTRSSQFGLRALRFAREMFPGLVLTVEPGIYFIPELIRQWKADGKFEDFIAYDKLEDYLDFGGIRIEDNVLLTPEGHRVLGHPIPKTIEEVEEIRKGDGKSPV